MKAETKPVCGWTPACLDCRCGETPAFPLGCIPVYSCEAWSLKLATTFSLLCLPSFRRPAQTPGWIHFPLNYQNRATSDRTASVEESLLPRPSHKGPSRSSRAGAGGWKRTSCPRPSRGIVLCALTAGLGGAARVVRLEGPPPSAHRRSPCFQAECPPDGPLLRAPLPAILLKRKYSRNGLKHGSGLNHGLRTPHLCGDRKH